MLARLTLLALLLVLIVPAPLHATSLARMNLEEMVAISPVIVQGTVVSTASRWNEDRSLILTEVTLRVETALKGGAPGEISFLQPGGRVGSLMVEVPGASAFRAGEEAVLFLAPDPAGRLLVTGLGSGRFDVVRDERTGRRVVRGLDPERVSRLETGPSGAEPLAVSGDGTVPLDRFLRRVRTAVRDAVREGGN